MGDAQRKRVGVRIGADGDLSYFIEQGADVDLLIVDDRAPHDRVYHYTIQVPSSKIDDLINGDPIGSRTDSRQAAITARVYELIDGLPYVKLIPPDRDGEDD